MLKIGSSEIEKVGAYLGRISESVEIMLPFLVIQANLIQVMNKVIWVI